MEVSIVSGSGHPPDFFILILFPQISIILMSLFSQDENYP